MRNVLVIALLFLLGCAGKYPAEVIVERQSTGLRAFETASPEVAGASKGYSPEELDGVSGHDVVALVADSTAPATAPEEQRRLGDFSKGSWLANVYGSAIFGDTGKGEMYALHTGVAYHFLDYQSIGIDLLGAYVDSEIDDNGGAIGLDVVYRNHFLREKKDNWTIFFQGGLGLQQASTNFAGERHFNFRIQIGFGASVKIHEHAHAFVGGAYQHISDAGIDAGIDAGGGFDGPMVYAGIMFPL